MRGWKAHEALSFSMYGSNKIKSSTLVHCMAFERGGDRCTGLGMT